MSWVKSVSVANEDVFDEDGNDIILQNKEWNKNMSKRAKDGYRDGVDAGKEASLQRGFNIGYQEGAEQMVTIGQLKGVLCALQCWSQLEHPGSPTFSSISRLLQEVLRQEEDMIKRMKTGMAQQQPPASINDITEAVEDMGMEHTDAGCGAAAAVIRAVAGRVNRQMEAPPYCKLPARAAHRPHVAQTVVWNSC